MPFFLGTTRLAGRIHVLLRREHNRIIDVEWMCAEAGYAREVLRLARATELDELHMLATRVEQTHPLLPCLPAAEVPPPRMSEAKYVRTLR